MNNLINPEFLDTNIPYDNLDEEIRPLINVLNFNCNLKTKHTRFKHLNEVYNRNKIFIIFESCVLDEQILSIINYLLKNNFNKFSFNKWIRPSTNTNEIIQNWIFSSPIIEIRNKEDKIKYINELVNLLKKYKER